MANERKTASPEGSSAAKAPNWIVLAETIRDGLNEEVWKRGGKYRSVTAWLADVANREGYAPASLRRMARVFDYLKSRMERSDFRKLKSSGDAPLAALEILVRLSELPDDPSRQYIDDVLFGRITYRHLRDIYNEKANKRRFTNARSDGIRRLKEVEERIYHLIGPDIARLSGKGFRGIPDPQVFFRHGGRFPYSLPDFASYHLTSKGEITFDGFEIRLVGLDGKMFQMNIMLALMCFHARFFRNYWLVLAESKSSRLADRISEHLRKLNMPSVGLIHVPLNSNGDPTSNYQVIRKPLKSASDDMQQLLKEFAPRPIEIVIHPNDPLAGRYA